MNGRFGFTLIEITSSLLIFAIGGTMALSVFNFNATNRSELQERAEAFEIGAGKIQTLILRSMTDSTWKSQIQSGTIATETWISSDTIDTQFAPIQNQGWKGIDDSTTTTYEVRSPMVTEGSSNEWRSYGATTSLSRFEWRYKLSAVNFSIKRSVTGWETDSNPPSLTTNGSNGQYLLKVEVGWPASVSNWNERKKITLETLITC